MQREVEEKSMIYFTIYINIYIYIYSVYFQRFFAQLHVRIMTLSFVIIVILSFLLNGIGAFPEQADDVFG